MSVEAVVEEVHREVALRGVWVDDDGDDFCDAEARDDQLADDRVNVAGITPAFGEHLDQNGPWKG